MPQDTFTLRLLARELERVLTGGKVNKILQPQREEISFIIYTQNRTLKLTLSANAGECGIYFTQDARENPLVAPNFCMLLRKYLSGAEILGVELPAYERIVCIRFLCVSDFSSCERVLRAEIMGKYSNLILTEGETILGALKTTSLDANFKRAILPGAKYTLPAAQDKIIPQNLAAMRALFSKPPEGDLAKMLFTHVAGLAPVTAEQIVKCYHGGDFAQHVHDFIFSDEVSPCVLERDGVPIDFLARNPGGGIPFPTISEAQSCFYSKKRAANLFQKKQNQILSAIRSAKKKQEKLLSEILGRQAECAAFEENRIKGELLTSNLYALFKGLKFCELRNYYDEAGGTMKIALDERLTPSQNAQNYFKKYHKQKRTLESLAPRERDAKREISYLESLLAAAESAKSQEDLSSLEEELCLEGLLKAQAPRKKTAPEIPFRSYEKDGFIILAGRNNLQNDKLVRQSAPEDLWLHTQKFHSCHVVIRTGGAIMPDDVLLYAAKICVQFSDAKGGGKVPVDYCKIKNVRKPSGAKAGFVVYHEYKTILIG